MTLSGGGVDETLNLWKSQMQESLVSVNDGSLGFESTHIETNPAVLTILNDEQRRAYDIVDWHLQETMLGKKPPQLLMMVPGEGGVGKSTLIHALTQDFGERRVGHWWVKGAYTGIAASLIDGKTLHVLAGIPVKAGKQSAHTLKKLSEFWRTKWYLIIDEILMLS